MARPEPLEPEAAAPKSLTAVIDRVMVCARRDTVTLRAVLQTVGSDSFAPILLLPAVAVATPLSGIPMFSSLMGILIFLVSVQMLGRRRHLWLPNWILRRSVAGNRLASAFKRLYPVAGWIDARTNKRLRLMRHRPLIYIPQALCVLSGAVMPFLEFVPFSSSMVGVGVALLALGMLARDGLLILIALIPYTVVSGLIYAAVA